MRVILSGGSCLIGTALTASLAGDGHEVIVLSRSPDWVVGLPKNARAVKWDGITAQGWGHLADGADVIVNLAGENLAGNIPFGMRWTAKRKERILNSRVNAGNAVVEAVRAAKVKPKVLIQASAIDIYGRNHPADMTEDSPAGDGFLAEVCQKWEAASAEIEDMGVRRVIIRTALVFDDRDGVLPWMVLPFQMYVGGPIGSGDQRISWIHIDDEVAAIRFLMDTETAKGIYNLSAPEVITYKAFGRVVGQTLGKPSYFPTPGFPFKLAFGEAASLLLDGLGVVPERLEQAGFKFQFPTARLALQDLYSKN
jgi:hypothetical protein